MFPVNPGGVSSPRVDTMVSGQPGNYAAPNLRDFHNRRVRADSERRPRCRHVINVATIA